MDGAYNRTRFFGRAPALEAHAVQLASCNRLASAALLQWTNPASAYRTNNVPGKCLAIQVSKA